MALLTYVRSEDGVTPIFAVVADDEGADYLFPEDSEAWLDESRLQNLIEMRDGAPTDEAGWMEMATANLGRSVIDEPVQVDDIDDAISQAEQALSEVTLDDADLPRTMAASDAFDQVSQDYPGFMESDDETSPEAIENFVMLQLGPIDPDGENGWLLRAQDGNPAPGDENAYVHFPGQPPDDTPDDESTEARQ